MKKQILILALAIFSFGHSFGQADCDIATGGLELRNAANTASTSSIPVGGIANFRFYLYNLGTSTTCTIPTGSVEVIFDFPNVASGPFVYNGPATFSTAHFSFTFSAIDNALIGTNTVPITNNDGDDGILVQVRGVRTGTASCNLNITQNLGISDNTANNTGSAPLTVAAVVPVKFNDIATEASDCNAKLKWSTSLETGASNFDVEYSPDGRNFIRVAVIPTKQIATGAAYEYAYPQGNGKGYYRLKMSNQDGGYSYSKIVTANITCNVKKVFLYPNPVSVTQLLHVNVSNYEGAVRGELINEKGQVVLKNVLRNGTNDVQLMTLPQGTYNYKVFDDNKEMQTYKVVIVK